MIQDLKITEWENPIVNEADSPQRTAEEMKTIFDSNSNQLRTVVNSLIDALSSDGASSIGAEVQGMEGTSVQELLAELKELTDRVVTDQDGTLFLANDGTYKLPDVGAAANGLPAGGSAGMVLVKRSDRFFDAGWEENESMSTTEYDTNNDGIVDNADHADNADKLGGKLPSAYQEAGDYASPAKLRTVTLGMSNWIGAEAPYTQAVTVQGVLADETAQAVHISPASGYGKVYGAAGVECTAQGNNSLTFSCETAPQSDIVLNIAIQEAGA